MTGRRRAAGVPDTRPETGPVVVIAGPTASGKSALAVALARRFDGVVINADSQQLYAELAILTARPTIEALEAAPHRLFGVVPCAQAVSAAWWARAAGAEARVAWPMGRLPILVGGTGLYLAAFLDGLAPLPAVPDAVRQAVRDRLGRDGPVALHAELARRDLAGATRLRPQDRQRVARALEVIEAAGRPIGWWQDQPREGGHPGPALPIVLDPPRAALYARCDRRLGAMVARGALDEAAAVAGLNLGPDRPAAKTLGLRELADAAAGRCTLAEAMARARQATRRYAKRQVTWFRHQMPSAHRLRAAGGARLVAEAARLVESFVVEQSPQSA